MSSLLGRFNLRTRKSMKLYGQIECTSCHRYYFPPENSDDENNDDEVNTESGEKLCCDCEEKSRYEPPPKRRAVQRQNGVRTPISKMIKQEKIDPVELQETINRHSDQFTSDSNQITTNHSNFNCDRMVQIHSSELLTQPMLPLNINLSNQLNIKIENNSTATDMIIGRSKAIRAHRKKTDSIQCEMMTNEERIKVKVETMITNMDTPDTLREKFPKASPFEFEFLMFLKASQP